MLNAPLKIEKKRSKRNKEWIGTVTYVEDINPTVSIIMLNINGLNIQIKRVYVREQQSAIVYIFEKHLK